MTEDEARATQAAFDGLGGLERWIAERRWEAIMGGWEVPGDLQGWRFRVEPAPPTSGIVNGRCRCAFVSVRPCLRGRAANRGPRHALTWHLFSAAAMRHQHLYLIIPVLVVIAALVLFFQRDKVTEGSGAHMPPSGEAARPTERR